jgi:WD40 repeat protein
MSSYTTGVVSFDLRDGTHSVLSPRPATALAVDRRERTVFFTVLGEHGELVRITPDGRAATLFSCPNCFAVALDPTGKAVATGSAEGIVRIGPAAGGEPHVFFARASSAHQNVAFSADGRWVASSAEAPSVRLWPVPDLTRTPLHKRTHDEVLATLHSWTNLRAVKDPQSPTGWKLEPGPFPGWAKLPER